MTPSEVVEFFGSRSAAAQACQISYQAVCDWETRGEVPKMRQYHIQTITDGALKVDQPPEVVCPFCGSLTKKQK